MADPRQIINRMMAALIDSYGCLDAAVETINARFGGSVSKGTLSKRLAGQQGWTVAHVIALEDAAGYHPVTRMMARRLNPDPDTAAGCILADAGAISKETGEALAAILAASQSADSSDKAQAIVEVDEAIDALRSARARLQQED